MEMHLQKGSNYLGHFRDAELFFHQVKTFDDTWNDILYFKDLFHLDLYLFFTQ